MAEEYNYDTFTGSVASSLGIPRFSGGPPAGCEAPDFLASDLGGMEVRLSDFRVKKNVLLQFGSITSPVFICELVATQDSIESLYRRYKERGFEFFIIYVRETHPGDKVPHHRSYEQKKRHAEKLRSEEGISIPILVDDLEGTIHRQYGMLPHMTYIIDRNGIVVYRSASPNTIELRDVLESLLYWEGLLSPKKHFRVVYSERTSAVDTYYRDLWKRVLERSGEKAVRDVSAALGWDPF